MDQPAHCGSLQRARRHGASLAQRVRARRCRGVEGDRGARPATGKDRSRAACRRASARSSRRRPAQLDDPAPHGRDRGARGRQDRQVAVVQGVAKKNFRWRRPAHAERPPDCRRDRTRGTAPSTAQGSGRSRRHHPPLRRRERGPDAPLSGAGVGLARCGPAGAGAGSGQESGDNRLTRSCHAPVDCAYEPDQAQPRLHRSPRATRPSVRSSTRTGNKTGRTGRGQRADPCQQAHS